MDGFCPEATAAEGSHLVLHQCNEGRHHNTHTFHGQGRHLESDALSAARGHKAKGVVPVAYTFNDFALDELGVMCLEGSPNIEFVKIRATEQVAIIIHWERFV